ncbi:Ultraviolet-B receptor UVR8 [Dendrobium catenatum]|uniref:Ultraviolet-B receptor UVR8 n=1 Tax=Dendrobium catenatum TaxID=906689 RepID=A0A2I0XEH5_9ASPA|nr:Ultraviolet-B receptor UVR8 [Dendrobium catenatum]
MALHPLRFFRTCFPSMIFSPRELRISLVSAPSSKLRIHPVWLNSRGALLQDRPRASSEDCRVQKNPFVPDAIGSCRGLAVQFILVLLDFLREFNLKVFRKFLSLVTLSSPSQTPARKQENEGAPIELVEDPKFVPLNADDPVFGPPIILCTEDMLNQSIWDAVHSEQPNLKDVEFGQLGVGDNVDHCSPVQVKFPQDQKVIQTSCGWRHTLALTESKNVFSWGRGTNGQLGHGDTLDRLLRNSQIAKSLPRICFMSGLTGEEMMMFIDAFPEIGLRPAVFAALVPNSANKLLKDVAEEIMGDHEMLGSISAVHSNHSLFSHDLTPIYKPCHSRKTINRALILHKGDSSEEREEEEKKEEKEEAPPRPPPELFPSPEDAGTLPDFRETPGIRRTL